MAEGDKTLLPKTVAIKTSVIDWSEIQIVALRRSSLFKIQETVHLDLGSSIFGLMNRSAKYDKYQEF